MKIFKAIDNVLAAFGNVNAMKRNHVDTFTENKIRQINGEKIAVASNGGIWVEYQELAGCIFINATVLSSVGIKTFKGSKLSFLGGKKDLIISSDTTEIESDYSNVSNRWITNISYIVSDEDIQFINSKEYSLIRIDSKKTTIEFSPEK